MAVRNGYASAVTDVAMPHTAGSRPAGKCSSTLSLRVGRRTARWNRVPHLSSRTEYPYSMRVVCPG